MLRPSLPPALPSTLCTYLCTKLNRHPHRNRRKRPQRNRDIQPIHPIHQTRPKTRHKRLAGRILDRNDQLEQIIRATPVRARRRHHRLQTPDPITPAFFKQPLMRPTRPAPHPPRARHAQRRQRDGFRVRPLLPLLLVGSGRAHQPSVRRIRLHLPRAEDRRRLDLALDVFELWRGPAAIIIGRRIEPKQQRRRGG